MQVLGLGYGWRDGHPFLRVRHLHDHAVHTLAMGGEVRLQVTAERRCTGYYDGTVSHPCPDGARLRTGVACEACQLRDAFRPCMRCDGSRCPRLSPAMRRYCQQDHHLYLACFGDDTIKVGTASHPRRRQRIVEQGPLAAVRVACGEGPAIKRMERMLSQGVFTETMRRSRKTALLAGSMSPDEARERVLDAAATLGDVLPDSYHDYLHPPEVVEPPALAAASRSLQVQPVQLHDDVVIAGQVVGAVGHVVFVEDDDGVFAFDLGELKARVIELSPQGGKKPVVQLGLF